MDPAAVVLLTVLVTAAALIIWSLNLRHKRQELLHRERMAALEKGTAPPVVPEAMATPAAASPRLYLLRGMIWLFAGFGLTVFLFFFISLVKTAGDRENLEMKFWRAQQLRNQGVPEEQVKEFLAQKPPERKGAEGVATLGLIPMGVGLAYLLFYSSEEKRVRARQRPEGPGDSS